MLSSGMRRHTFFFVRKRGYTLHIDAPEGGTKMETEKVYAMPFAKIYPILVAKAVGEDQADEQMRKSSLLHTDRECGIILKKTLYGKDKHDERSGYYETPCRLCQWL